MPDHLVALQDGWAAWRWLVLRGAGFPASEVLRFSAAASSAAIAALIALEATTERAREQAIQRCLALLERTPDDRHRPIRKAIARLRAGQVPETTEPELAAAIQPLRSADDERAAQRRAVEDVFVQDSTRISGAIRELAQNPRFREAVVWQNRALIENTLEPLLEAPVGATDSRTRQKETMIAGYGQRYCVKNDTIGFFGPVGWAHIGDGDEAVKIQPGETLLDIRNVHYEYWCIDTLAARLAEDPELRRELAPRRMPTVRVEGTTVHYPVARSTQIAHEYVVLLNACDGRTSARAIAQAMSADVAEADVYDMLAELVEQRLVRWSIEIPTAGQHPERHLQRVLDQLPPGDARDRAFHTFAQLEAGRAAVADAGGDPIALDRALRAFDDLFSSLTSVAATRRAGQTYAGRTLLYLDARRNVDVELGAPFVARLGPPLTLMMLSARWYTHAVAAAYRPVLQRVYDELRAQTGDARVDYLQYLEQILPHFAEQGKVAPTVKPIVDELHRRWMALLDVAPDARHIERSVAALQAQVEATFAAPGPGWPQARHHSPDVMITAADLAALRRGEFTCVVNETHVGDHSYVRPVFLNLHPDPASLIRARRLDLVQPVITTVEARTNALRSDHFAPVPEDIDIETTDARSWRAPENVLAVAELVVEEIDGQLRVRTRDASRVFDIVEVFEGYFQLAAETNFFLLPPLPHVPRVTIDGLVLTRECWSFATAELAFASANGLDRFIGARRWALQHGLPRFIFVRVAQETKPYFIDLESPIYVEILARFVRQATSLEVSEMLPAIDQTWLADKDGQTYTAELRMAVRDPQRWRPPA